MGQAKQRGSYAERLAAGKQKVLAQIQELERKIETAPSDYTLYVQILEGEVKRLKALVLEPSGNPVFNAQP